VCSSDLYSTSAFGFKKPEAPTFPIRLGRALDRLSLIEDCLLFSYELISNERVDPQVRIYLAVVYAQDARAIWKSLDDIKSLRQFTLRKWLKTKEVDNRIHTLNYDTHFSVALQIHNLVEAYYRYLSFLKATKGNPRAGMLVTSDLMSCVYLLCSSTFGLGIGDRSPTSVKAVVPKDFRTSFACSFFSLSCSLSFELLHDNLPQKVSLKRSNAIRVSSPSPPRPRKWSGGGGPSSESGRREFDPPRREFIPQGSRASADLRTDAIISARDGRWKTAKLKRPN